MHGKRDGDRLDRGFAADAPNRTWVMDCPPHVLPWARRLNTAFILDVFALNIVAWNVAPSKAVELVDVSLVVAPSCRRQEGQPESFLALCKRTSGIAAAGPPGRSSGRRS